MHQQLLLPTQLLSSTVHPICTRKLTRPACVPTDPTATLTAPVFRCSCHVHTHSYPRPCPIRFNAKRAINNNNKKGSSSGSSSSSSSSKLTPAAQGKASSSKTAVLNNLPANWGVSHSMSHA